jgi:hypothetical protein
VTTSACCALQQFATIFLLVPPNSSKLPGTQEKFFCSVVPRQLAVYFEFRKPVLVQYTFFLKPVEHPYRAGK